MPSTRSSARRPAAKARFDDAAWRATHRTRTYVVPGLEYEAYAPAYRYGMLVADKHGHKTFVEVEPLLAEEWDDIRGASPLSWAQARPAVQDGYAGVVRVRPVKTAKARTARPKAGTGTRRATATTRTKTTKATTKARTGGDNLKKRGPQDRARVNVNESWEVDYWCDRFGVTPARLRQAVKKVGPMAKDVRRELKK